MLWTIVAALALAVFLRRRPMFAQTVRFGAHDFLQLLPRIAIGMIGSGFIAEILPQQSDPGLARRGLAACTGLDDRDASPAR